MTPHLSDRSLEGWRLRTRPRPALDPPSVNVTGHREMAALLAERLAFAVEANVETGRSTSPPPADVVVVAHPPDDHREGLEARTRAIHREASLMAPDSVLVIAAPEGLLLSRSIARGSGVNPYLVLSPGALPWIPAERRRLAKRHDLHPAQVEVLAIGGDRAETILFLERYAGVGGLPVTALTGPRRPVNHRTRGREVTTDMLIASAVTMTRSVLEDRRQVLCCGAWIEGTYGLPGGFVTAPVRVGCRGAEDPLPLRLTLDERTFLHRSVIA